MKFALTGVRIFDGYRLHSQSALVVENDKIVDIRPESDVPDNCEIIQLTNGVLTPGFIDLQINGAGGVLFNNAPTLATLNTMAEAMLPYGVTNLLPTIITDDVSVTEAAIKAATEASSSIPGILGIHVEGPFFSVQKKGVHRQEAIRHIGSSDWTWLESLKELPSLLTLAPEEVQVNDIQKLDSLGIRVCAGHTNASYEDVVAAHNAGLNGFTHLYNAMRPLNGREPGVVGAALALKETWAGLIADGIHVHDASMKIAIESKGYEKIFLVSDAMATAGSTHRSFSLYGETIEERDGRLINAEGNLAGSAITLLDAVQYCIETLGLPIEHTLAMASRVPAQFMKLDHQVGTFAPGARADICLLDDHYCVKQVWQNGISKIKH